MYKRQALFILAGKVVIEWDIKTMPTWMRVRTEEKKRRSEIHERVRKRKMEEIRYIEGNVKNQQEELSLLEHAGEIVEIHGSIYKIRKIDVYKRQVTM